MIFLSTCPIIFNSLPMAFLQLSVLMWCGIHEWNWSQANWHMHQSIKHTSIVYGSICRKSFCIIKTSTVHELIKWFVWFAILLLANSLLCTFAKVFLLTVLILVWMYFQQGQRPTQFLHEASLIESTNSQADTRHLLAIMSILRVSISLYFIYFYCGFFPPLMFPTVQ